MNIIELKRLIFIASFFLFLSINTFSQNKVRNYYEIINRAELHICNTHYYDALVSYDSAFRIIQPFNIDLSNAVECAIDAKNTQKLLFYLGWLKAKGYDPKPTWDMYKHIMAFNPKIIDSLNAFPVSSLCKEKDTTFISEVKLRYELDQRLDKERIKHFAAKDSLANVYRDSFNCVVNSNAKWLKQWIEMNGFPSEECYYSIDFKQNVFPKLINMITHYFQGENWDMYDILKKSVYDGLLRPIDLAEKVRFVPQNAVEYGIAPYVFMGDSLILQKYDVEIVNKNRYELMLEPYEDYLTKVNYILNNGDDKYYFSTYAAVILFVDYDTFNGYLEKRRKSFDTKQSF
ncbi:MAG: hypothetical protein AB7S48_09885 [Bacteroidales bacterium]